MHKLTLCQRNFHYAEVKEENAKLISTTKIMNSEWFYCRQKGGDGYEPCYHIKENALLINSICCICYFCSIITV